MITAALVLSASLPRAVAAQAPRFRLDRWIPTTGVGDGMANEAAPSEGAATLGVSGTYAHHPLSLYGTAPGNGRVTVVGHQLTMHAFGEVPLSARLRIVFDAPFGHASTDEAVLPMLAEQSGAGTGNLRLGARIRILSVGSAFTLFSSAYVALPTALGNRWFGDSGVPLELRAGTQLQLGDLSIVGNLGVRSRPAAELANLRVGNEVLAGATLSLHAATAWTVGAEFSIVTGLGAGTFAANASTSAEVDAFVRSSIVEPVHVFGAAGVGALNGYGTPDFRVILGAIFSFAESHPERHVSRQRPTARTTPIFASTQQSKPVVDTDGDGLEDFEDACLTQAEDINGVLDADGCPEGESPDSTKVAAPTEVAQTSISAPSELNLRHLQHSDVVILSSVHFATDRSDVRPGSVELLKELVFYLRLHPEFTSVVVEGHTDSRGSEVHNDSLSLERSLSVARCLTHLGIAADRIRVVAKGSRAPAVGGTNASELAMNRRVEIHFSRGETNESH